MAIDDVPEQHELLPEEQSSKSNQGILFAVAFVIIAVLVIGEIRNINRLSSLTEAIDAQQASARQLDGNMQQLSQKVSALESSDAELMDAVKSELQKTSKQVTLTSLRRARSLVDQAEKQQQEQASELKQEIAQKADQQQVGSLSQDVTSTKSDLADTKKELEATRSDLGMARSQFGTLIARNHDQIEQLRRMGERNYVEFTLTKNRLQHVANVSLILKKTNVKHHRFNLNLVSNDVQIEKKDRTIDEPIFFSISGTKSFYELVINQVQSNRVTGYISTPKGLQEAATATEGGR